MRAVALAALLTALGLGASACGGHPRAAPTTTTTTTTPVARPVPASFAPVALSAPSARDIWILGNAHCSSGSCAALVHSTDGGLHFAAATAPSARAGTLDSIRFATPDDGYVYDGHAFGRTAPLWVTDDGGSHWRQAPFGNLLALGTGGGKAFAITATCANGNCHRVELRTAPVGGNTWSEETIESGPIDPLVAMTVSGSSIWLSVSDTSSTHANQTLLVTLDAGRSFAAEQSPCVTGLAGALSASSANVVWAICPTGMLATASRTTDTGKTWSTLDVGRELANSSQLVPASDTTAVLATGDQAQLLRTTNGGSSFSVVQPVSAGYWNHIDFADAAHAYALRIVGTGQAAPKLYASGDGGATWRLVPLR